MRTVIKIFRRFFHLILLNTHEFPDIQLNDLNISLQRLNIKEFQSNRSKFLFCGLTFFLTILLMILSDKYFIKMEVYWFFFAMPSAIAAIYFAFKYKCPNCKHIVEARSFSISSGLSASKGLSLFPTRCHHCGYYLSNSALHYDLEEKKQKQKRETPT